MAIAKIVYDGYNMPINKRQWVEVRIYKNLSHLRAVSAPRSRKSLLASYTWDTERNPRKGLFGEVNFAHGHTDAVTVAHEFTHFILDYAKATKLKDEKLCRIMDDCIATFNAMLASRNSLRTRIYKLLGGREWNVKT